MSKKKQHKKDNQNRANEPELSYDVTDKSSSPFKTITISTLNEQEDDMRKYSASLTSLERIGYLYELIDLAYGHILKNTPTSELWEKKVHIQEE